MNKLWLIKDRKGRIFGPYSEKEICFYIDEGEFKGEESFSSYPTGKWKPLSAHLIFYEKILAKLNKKDAPAYPSGSSVSVDESRSEHKSAEKESMEPTHIVTPREVVSSSKKKKKKVKIKLSKEFRENVLVEEGYSDVIEMEDLKEKFFDKLNSSLKIPVVLFILLVSVFIFFSQDRESKNEEQIRLLSISQNREPWTQEELKEKFQSGLLSYYRGTASNYLNSQMQYVQILEGNPEEVEIYLYLCLVYLEIWPFAYQDTRDKNVLSATLNIASRKNKGGIYSGVCKSVQALIDKNPEQALMITNSSLNVVDNLSPIFFYYIKAKALKALNKTTEARSYLRSIYKLRPEWAAPYMLDAQMFYEKSRYGLASELYQKVLSIFPGHTSAGLRMGIIEYKYLKKPKKSETRLKSILMKSHNLVKPNILIEAYITLANIYLKQNNKKEVLKYANKAYALNPEHPDVILLRRKLGEEGDFENTKVQARGLIYKGDMLVSQGNCSSAKKYFEKAYSASGKRNALAALKMAQCYWQSGASGQAIRWLKRSINADNKMLEAYFLLSDYLSDLYDFENAKDVLNAVKNQHPSNYDLFKAYALLSFRQEQYQAAITYAERSLKFYTSDVEIYVLLSQAYFALKKSHKAFSYAKKAIEEDVNNIPAQITYALALDLAYGSHRVQERFEELIDHFPLIVEYSQALGEYYFDKGMYDKALAQFKYTIKQNPKFKPAHIYLGRIYNYLSYKEGGRGEKYEQALKYFLEATLLDISDPEPIFYVGQSHMQHKQYQLAENEFEKILRINPNYPLIHYYIGLVNFYQQGEKDLEKALKSARTQSAKNPHHFLPYKLAGDIYKLRSKGVFDDPQEKRITYELCAKGYQKALKYLKNDIEISIGLIECYKGAGNLDTALQLALQLSKEEGLSGYSELYREIGSIFELKDQYEKARSHYNSYFTLNPGAKDRSKIETRINKLINEKRELSHVEEEK